MLRTAHGEVRTPAFVPLATKASVGLLPEEVAALGYEMVLGNTFHLFLRPGGELIERLGGLHRFMGWERPIITDSGGFQVFSMGHGTVADEIKGASRTGAATARGTHGRDPRDRGGRRALPLLRRRSRALPLAGELDGGAGALGSDIVLAFDECTPFHVDRDYTARSTERTHRWLERCLRWHAEHGPRGQLFYGIVQGGVYEDLRIASARAVARQRLRRGSRSAARWAPRRRRCTRSSASPPGARAARYERAAPPARDRRDRRPDRRRRARHRHLRLRDADAAARHGVALVADPARRWRLDLTKGRWREAAEPLLEGCPCPACARGLSRAYLSYLARTGELTGQRLLTLHNLTFVAGVMGGCARRSSTGGSPRSRRRCAAGRRQCA